MNKNTESMNDGEAGFTTKLKQMGNCGQDTYLSIITFII